jgi:hypothetical protein
MTWSLNCVCEEEPAGFHPEGVRGISVRLSVETEKTDPEAARDDFKYVLGRLAEIGDADHFAVYQKTGATTLQKLDAGVDLLSEPFDPELSKRFIGWLDEYASTAKNKAFYTSAAGQESVTEATAAARDVVLAAASRLAPLPQRLHLSFVLRLTLPPVDDQEDQARILAIVPRFPDEAFADQYVFEEGSAGARISIPVDGGTRGRTATLIKRLALTDPTTNVDPGTGFCKGSDTTPQLHVAWQRFEQRAGSLMAGFVAAGEVKWDLASPELTDELHARRLGWRAVMALATALDPLLMCLGMPGRDKRQGPLLPVLVDVLSDSVEDIRREVVEANRKLETPDPGNLPFTGEVDRAALGNAVRDGVGALVLELNRLAKDDRTKFIEDLAVICLGGAGASKGTWLQSLLDAFAKGSSDGWLKTRGDWGDLKSIKDATIAIDKAEQVRELERNLADLNETLTGEAGVENSLLKLFASTQVKKALLDVLEPLTGNTVQAGAILARAATKLQARLGSQLNGAVVSRQGAGSLLADLLAYPRVPGTVADMETAAGAWQFWARRFCIEPATVDAITPVLQALVSPVPDPVHYFRNLGGGIPADYESPADEESSQPRMKAALEEAAAEMHASVLRELFPRTEDRFIPDSAPRPLAIHVAVDPAADDSGPVADDFSAAYAGMSLLMRRSFGGPAEPWSYANLAEIVVPSPLLQQPREPSIFEGIGVQPLPTTIQDGRRELFQTYDGLPFSSAAFRPASPGALFETDYPERSAAPAYQPAPELAYGAAFELAAHAVGRSGSLPNRLQDTRPWMPKPVIGLEEPTWISRARYSRTTAIGQTSIAEADGGKRIGVAPGNVRPLSADYPRIVLATGDNTWLDVYRNTDGSGAIVLPEKDGQSVRVRLYRLWNWAEVPCEVTLDVLDSPATVSDGSWLARATITLAPGTVPHVEVVLSRNAGSLHIDVGAGPVQFARAPVEAEAWLRLQSASTAKSCISMEDPAGDMRGGAAASRPVPDKLLLVGQGDVWRAPHAATAALSIGFPRIGYLDFERWINNPALKGQVFAGVPEAHIDYFCNCLLACHIGRGHNRHERLAALLDRLPDPAVTQIQLEALPVDCLRDSPAGLQGRFGAIRELLAVPKLGEVLKAPLHRIFANGRTPGFDPDWFEELLKTVDGAYTIAFEVKCAPRAAAALGWIGPHGAVKGVTVPEGLSARLTVRPVVSAAHFASSIGGASVIDTRLLQYAVGSMEGDDTKLLFEGGSLLVESMTGPLQAEAGSSRDGDTWSLSRAAWTALTEKLVTHLGGRARRYDLAAMPAHDKWQWRQLGWIDVHTQRWRFTGMPIDRWPTRTGALAHAPDAVSFEPAISVATEEIVEFERQAFHRRLDSDAEVVTTPLSTLGDTTTLITVQWDKPAATWFRHRFVLRSRYAGAMKRQDHGECDAWPERLPADPPAVTEWRRVVMLGERGGIAMTRPQLRALMPLTTSPDGGHSTPPVAAILHDEAFSHGGLAERIAPEVTTGVGYGGSNESGTGGLDKRVRAIDARKEVGPDPRLSYAATPAGEAQLTVLCPEGPMGLTFDATHGGGQMFPNSSWLLHPRQLRAGETVPGPASMEEHFISVAMRRYLAPEWLVDEGPVNASFGQTWWHEHKCSAVKTSLLWLAGGAHHVDVATCKADGNDIVVVIDRAVVDQSALAASSSDPLNPDTRPLVLCRLPGAKDRDATLALLHSPVDRQNAQLSVFLMGTGGVPVLLASIDWSIPRIPLDPQEPGVQVALVLDCVGQVSRTNASQTTALKWVRTNRNFDANYFGGLAGGRDRLLAAEVQATWGRATHILKLDSRNPADLGRSIWARSEQSTQGFPVHAQRHVAALLSSVDKGVGRAVEQLREAHMLKGVGTDVAGAAWLNDEGTANVRLLEFELPSQIVGFGSAIPLAFQFAYFDLASIGHSAGTRHLSFHLRLVGSTAARKALRELELGLRADESTGTQAGWKTIKVSRDAAGAELVALQLTMELDENWNAMVTKGHWLTAAGAEEVLNILPAGAQLVNGAALLDAQGLALKVVRSPGQDELWFEIGMLASSAAESGFDGKVDFDWFFGQSRDAILDGVAAGAIDPASLRAMREAQARVIAVSPPIAITKEL